MSKRNGDRARFQKDRKRRMLRRQRLHALMKTLRAEPIGADGRADLRPAAEV
jgi:hypothetical protein